MPMQIRGRNNNVLDVTNRGAIRVDVTMNYRSWERSVRGKLFGVGTEFVDLPEGFDGALMRWHNKTENQVLFVQKLIFGWDGGDPSNDRKFRGRDWVCRSLIHYQQNEPTAKFKANESMGNENVGGVIKASSLIDSQVWDGAGTTGMCIAGGYPAIPNTIPIGNLSIPIDGEIVIPPDASQTFHVKPEVKGTFHLAVVFYCLSFEEIEDTLGSVYSSSM